MLSRTVSSCVQHCVTRCTAGLRGTWPGSTSASHHQTPYAFLLAYPSLNQRQHRWLTSPRATEQADADTEEQAQPKPVVFKVRPITKGDVEVSFARSSGAGGQNVNKVSTKVDMRWAMEYADWVPEEVKEQIRIAEKNRFTTEGVLVVQSQRHRTQAQNLDDALAKLQAIIDAAVEAATPKIADEATVKRVKAQIKAGKERRLQDKKKDSTRKKERSRRDWD